MAVSRRLRFEILRRDNHTCRYCGRTAPDVKLTVDHVHPVALGGKDDPSNLVAACADCNAGKTSIAPGSQLVADVSSDAVKWAAAVKEAAYWASIDRDVEMEAVEKIDAAWKVWGFTVECDGKPCRHHLPRSADWPDTVRRLHSLGLDTESMIDFVGKSMRRNGVANDEKWTYFCGCCWRAIDDLQEVAKDIVRANEQAEEWSKNGT